MCRTTIDPPQLLSVASAGSPLLWICVVAWTLIGVIVGLGFTRGYTSGHSRRMAIGLITGSFLSGLAGLILLLAVSVPWENAVSRWYAVWLELLTSEHCSPETLIAAEMRIQKAMLQID